jgi:hypothetical protein
LFVFFFWGNETSKSVLFGVWCLCGSPIGDICEGILAGFDVCALQLRLKRAYFQ